MENLTIDEAKRVIKIVHDETKPIWKKWIVRYEDLDYAFLGRGFEQGSFWCQNFVRDYLAKYGMEDIGKIGKVFQILNYDENKKYDREFAGGINSDFYRKLKQGEAGKEGELFYKAVMDYCNSEGKKGFKFWKLLWGMLRSCYLLTHNYNGSFVEFVKQKLSNVKGISNVEFKNLLIEGWKEFLNTSPWKDLPEIGREVFSYIFSDTPDFSFYGETFKLDAANKGFLKVTGMLDLVNGNLVNGSLSDDQYEDLMKRIGGDINIRDINKSIYEFYAEGGSNLCKPRKSCNVCIISSICKKRF